MTTLKVSALREFLLSAVIEAQDKIADDYVLATKNEWNIYSDSDRANMKEQLAQYGEFLADPDRWFKSLARVVTREAKQAAQVSEIDVDGPEYSEAYSVFLELAPEDKRTADQFRTTYKGKYESFDSFAEKHFFSDNPDVPEHAGFYIDFKTYAADLIAAGYTAFAVPGGYYVFAPF